jgi:diaminopimelate epimerase
MSIETKAGILRADVKGDFVKINMTEPKDIRPGIDIEIERKTYQLNLIDTGVPHAVCFTDNIALMAVSQIGRAIRIHKAFSPRGTNVDFVQLKGKNSILMRTYERGVEAETLACGTGATASAIISNMVKGCSSPVKVITKGGELIVYFKRRDKKFTDVYLQGNAKKVFEGKIGGGHA